MKKNILNKIIASFITSISIISLSNVCVYADWKKDNIGWWYESDKGYIKNTWLYKNSKWYYFDYRGYMVTGWVYDSNGKWYYLDESGAMLSNTITPDGYTLNPDGSWNASIPKITKTLATSLTINENKIVENDNSKNEEEEKETTTTKKRKKSSSYSSSGSSLRLNTNSNNSNNNNVDNTQYATVYFNPVTMEIHSVNVGKITNVGYIRPMYDENGKFDYEVKCIQFFVDISVFSEEGLKANEIPNGHQINLIRKHFKVAYDENNNPVLIEKENKDNNEQEKENLKNGEVSADKGDHNYEVVDKDIETTTNSQVEITTNDSITL